MKLKSEIDIICFLKTVKTCAGSVFLETEEGDKLNLKSVLSQYVFSVIITDPKILEESRIVCGEEDARILEEYLVTEKQG